MDVDKGPLTEQHFEELEKQLDRLRKGRMVIDRAARAGIDVKDFREKTNELEQQLMRIKGSFFPGR